MEGQIADRTRRLTGAHSRVRLRLASDEGLVGAIRRGEPRAFEALYDRHAGELLAFCTYMLASRADAEDALQATFTAAYRALRTDERPVAVRPWLFAIARNQSLTILRRRRPTVELEAERAPHGDPAHELELREEVRDTLVRLRELPERQRAAMVLAELRGFSQAEIGDILGVRAEQVKALVYQARSDLISERRAREADCDEIREEISNARGSALLRGRLRRHVRSCEDCRTFAAGVARQRRQLNSLFPLAPALVLKLRTLQDALQEALAGGLGDPSVMAGGATLGGTVAGAALQFAGGGTKAIAVKVAAGAAMLGLGASVGASLPPSRSITRLAGDVVHIGARTSAGHARSGHLGARFGSGAGGAQAPGPRTALSGVVGTSARGEAEERGAAERSGGPAKDHGKGRSGEASGSTRAPARYSPTSARAVGALRHQARYEARALAHEGRESAAEERRAQRAANQTVREERRHEGEESRHSEGEHRQSGEERRREAEQRRSERLRERDRSTRQGERQKLAAARQHEREKRKHERERSHQQHQRERERAARKRQRHHQHAGIAVEEAQ